MVSIVNKFLIGKLLFYNFYDCSFNDECIMYKIGLFVVGFNKKYLR